LPNLKLDALMKKTYFRLNKPTFFLFLGLLISLSITGCLSSRQAALHIPAESGVVLKANLLSLMLKMHHAKGTFREDFSQVAKSSAIPENQLIGRLQSSGINFLRAFMFSTFEEDATNYFALNFPVSNPKKVEPFLKLVFDTLNVQKEGGISFFKLSERSILAWTDEVITYLNMPKSAKFELPFQKAQAILTMPEDSSLLMKNDNYRKLNKVWAEVTVWANLGRMAQSPGMQKFLSSHEVTKDIKLNNTYLQSLAHFHRGKMNAQTELFLSEQGHKRYKNLFRPSINPTVLYEAPIGNTPRGMLALAVNMSEVHTLLEDLHLTDEAQRAAEIVNLPLDQLMAIFSGDVVLFMEDDTLTQVVSANRQNANPQKMKRKGPQHNYMIGLGLNSDRTNLDSLINELITSSLLVKKEDHYLFFDEYIIIERPDALYITKVQDKTQQFAPDPAFGNAHVRELATKNALVFYGGRSLIDGLIHRKAVEDDNLLLDLIDLPLLYSVFHTENLQDNITKGSLATHFTDADENSVVIFYNHLKELLFRRNEQINNTHEADR